jgi:hypothetical protein
LYTFFKAIRSWGWLSLWHDYYGVRTSPQNTFPKFQSKSFPNLFSRLLYLQAFEGTATPKILYAIFNPSVQHVQLIITILIKYFTLIFTERKYFDDSIVLRRIFCTNVSEEVIASLFREYLVKRFPGTMYSVVSCSSEQIFGFQISQKKKYFGFKTTTALFI